MVTPAQTAETATAPAAPPAPKDSLVTKVEKYVEGYRAKIQKLQEENQRLRATIAEARNTNSRVRRIPKKAAAPADVVEPTA